jgi:transketolase
VPNIQQLNLKEMELMANQIRQDIINMLVEAGSGHSAGPLGMADVFTALYFGGVLNYDPKNPLWPDRDRLVLSNGHICPVLYATMARAGFFPVEELKTLRKLGTRLQGHPHRTVLPGLETTSGPLGSGLSQACGIALAGKMDALTHSTIAQGGEQSRTTGSAQVKKFQVYCLMSDAEHQSGNTWEAAMFAGNLKLANLTAILDRNNIQIDGNTEDVMPLEPLAEKYRAFNWAVIEVDGHNIEEIINACNRAKAIVEKPVMIIARTIPGKGVDFMEFDYKWHGSPPGTIEDDDAPPKAKQAEEALRQLRTLGGKIASEHE